MNFQKNPLEGAQRAPSPSSVRLPPQFTFPACLLTSPPSRGDYRSIPRSTVFPPTSWLRHWTQYIVPNYVVWLKYAIEKSLTADWENFWKSGMIFFLNHISGLHTARVPQDGLLFNLTKNLIVVQSNNVRFILTRHINQCLHWTKKRLT